MGNNKRRQTEKGTRKLIYILRARCEKCKLDKMVSFYRVPNATPTEMYVGHEEHMINTWPEKYGCDHAIYFDREIDKNYVWDLKENKAVPR